MPVSLIILAAGQGTRMNSDLPKVLHPLGAAPLLHHAMRAGQALDPDLTVVVAGHGAEAVTKAAHAFDPQAQVVLQAEQLGTAHAVLQAAPAAGDATGRCHRALRRHALHPRRNAGGDAGRAPAPCRRRAGLRRRRSGPLWPPRDAGRRPAADRRIQGRDRRGTRHNSLQFRRDLRRRSASVAIWWRRSATPMPPANTT